MHIYLLYLSVHNILILILIIVVFYYLNIYYREFKFNTILLLQQRVDATKTRSLLRLRAGYADDRNRLECQAMAPSMPQIKDTHAVTLHVNCK